MSLQAITRRQIHQAIHHDDPTALRWWTATLLASAGWTDPASNQITSPGLLAFLRMHAHIRTLTVTSTALAALPFHALEALALLASQHHGIQ